MIAFHYTNFTGLKSILRTRLWRFTNIRHLNDTEEWIGAMEWFANKLRDIGDQSELSEQIRSVLKDLRTNGEPLPWYTASFSKRQDNDYLWQEYADGGRGVCIEVQIDQLAHLACPILEVCYGEDCWDDRFNRVYPTPLTSNDIPNEVLGGIVYAAGSCKTFEKWNAEEEVRLFGVVPLPEMVNDASRDLFAGWHQVDENGKLFAARRFDPSSVTRVFVRTEAAKEIVIGLLDSNSFTDTKIVLI